MLGLGDSYEEQLKRGGCGLGRGFEPGTPDRQFNNSIMQNGDANICRMDGVPLSEFNPDWSQPCTDQIDCGQDCPTCPGTFLTCDSSPAYASELSWAGNFDPLPGSGLATCPTPVPAEAVLVAGDFDPEEPTFGPITSSCGNGVFEPELGEQCDPEDTVTVNPTCPELGLEGLGGEVEPVSCLNNCTLFLGACNPPDSGYCTHSQGQLHACDSNGEVPAGVTCETFGRVTNGSGLACGLNCSLQFANCNLPPQADCGNGTIDPGEHCDHGGDPGSVALDADGNPVTCGTFFGEASDSELVTCNGQCAFNTSSCRVFCAEVAASPWACDAVEGEMVPPTSCAENGLPAGTSKCYDDCVLNLSECGPVIDGTSWESIRTTAHVRSAWQSAVDGSGTIRNVRFAARRLGTRLWAVHAYGRGKDYVDGTPGEPVHIRTFKLLFHADTLQVQAIANGAEAPFNSGSLGNMTLGGQPDANGEGTGAFVVHATRGQAAPLTLSVDFGELFERQWQWYFDEPGETSGPTHFSNQTRIVALDEANGNAPIDQVAQCDNPEWCELFDNTSQRWEGAAHRHVQKYYAATQVVRDHFDASSMVLSEREMIPLVLQHRWGFADPVFAADQPDPEPPTLEECGGALVFNADAARNAVPDAIVIVIDRSISMTTPVDAEFSFGTGVAESRLAFAQAGARTLLDLASAYDPRPRTGMVSFNELATQDQSISDLVPTPADPGDLLPGQITFDDFKDKVDVLVADGDTAIGSSLLEARTMLMAEPAMSKAIILLSDGENNRPDPLGDHDPEVVSDLLVLDGIKVYTMPTGNAADEELLSLIANKTGGAMFNAPAGDELPATFAESYARANGEGLVVERTAVALSGGEACGPNMNCPSGTAAEETPLGCRCFELSEMYWWWEQPIWVNEGALSLDVLISARNADVTTWQPIFALLDPSGNVALTHESPDVDYDEFYRQLVVPNPADGVWTLWLGAGSFDEQYSFIQAHVQDPATECYPRVSRGIAGDDEAVVVTAHASYAGRSLDGAQITGAIIGPDGVRQELTFDQGDGYGDYFATVASDEIVYRGLYQIVVGCYVPEGTDYVLGEGAVGPEDGEEYSGVPEFYRVASTAVFADTSTHRPLNSFEDCDNDGVANGEEGDPDLDTDGDGLPDICDDDDDKDDVPDIYDPAPKDPNVPFPIDPDDDEIISDSDNCPYDYNPEQEDFDDDGIGDACDENSLVADAGPDQVLECDGEGGAFVVLDGSNSGALEGSLDYSWTASVDLNSSAEAIASGTFPVGPPNTATLTVSQGAISKSDSAIITVIDSTEPVIFAPPTVFAPTCGAVDLGEPVAADSCSDALTITNDAPSTFSAGVTVVTWQVVDAAGNIDEDEQLVVVDLGDDPACCPSGANVIHGTSNNDVLYGTAGPDCILGYGAQDTIYGYGGNDVLSGGHGDDIIYGGPGNDLVQGGTGQDTLTGGVGDDVLRGGSGDDNIFAGAGADVISGGDGQDEAYGEDGPDRIYGNEGDDFLSGGGGDDYLNGGGLHDQCDGGAGVNTFMMCENVPDSECNEATYEAEGMYHSTGGSISGGWNIWSNGYISANHDFTEGPVLLNVVAKGEQGGGQWPNMRVLVGGNLIETFIVDETAWTEYPVTFDSSSATQEIRLEFNNDYHGGSGNDRNLLVDKVSVECGSASSSSVYDFESGVTGWTNIGSPGVLSSTDSTYAFDGSRSLRLDINGGGEPTVSVAPVSSPPAGATVTLQVYVPSGAPVAALSPYLLDSNWSWTDGYTSTVNKGTWQELSVTVPSGAPPLNRVGLKVYLTGPYSGPIYIDAVDW